MNRAVVVGGGLAGCEAALQLARRGVKAQLYEMRPGKMTPAHQTGLLAELVCSNSLKSQELSNAHGLLKEELRRLHSFVLGAAYDCQVPAGKSLAVDRRMMAERVTDLIRNEPNIELVNEETAAIPDEPAIVATGPLTSDRMSDALKAFLGRDSLFFYDAIAPIVSHASIDFGKVFRGSRYGVDGSYVNCPMNEEEYRSFCEALIGARTYPLKDFEEPVFFEGCLPIEEVARRGPDTLRFAALKPVGFERGCYGVVQLRPENREATMYSVVGGQTKMVVSEQERVFRMIPGLAKADFLRYGSAHRNTYVLAPESLRPTMQTIRRSDLLLAGQLTGVEGYVESIGTGLLAGLNLSRILAGQDAVVPPPETMLGGLAKYLITPSRSFAPMNANFGLVPYHRDRGKIVERSVEAIERWMHEQRI